MSRVLLVVGKKHEATMLGQMFQELANRPKVVHADSLQAARKHLCQTDFDAVFVDAEASATGPLELLAHVLEDERTKGLPVVVMADRTNRAMKRKALEFGAAELLDKPVDKLDLAARWKSILNRTSTRESSTDDRRSIPPNVGREVASSAALLRSRLDMIWRLGGIAEYREELTGSHVVRVGFFSHAIATHIGLPQDFTETLFQAAPLHDVGNIGIPDVILLKRESLTPREWEIVHQHCVIGEKLLRQGVSPGMPSEVLPEAFAADAEESVDSVLEMAAVIALTHHEKWDGSGYPQQLAGEAIPMASRIVAICDVFDALTSERPYREPHPEDVALEIIRSASGKHFDPEVCTAFVDALPKLRSLRQAFADDVAAITGSDTGWEDAAWIFEDETAGV